jgi:hypothetical protein
MLRLASDHCRYGYPRITALLQYEGWTVLADLFARHGPPAQIRSDNGA